MNYLKREVYNIGRQKKTRKLYKLEVAIMRTLPQSQTNICMSKMYK